MDISERLAAHAAGELRPDEAASLEAELARDPALRAEFQAILRVDQFLANLDEVAPPAEFSANLRATLRDELASAPAVASLEAARARRERRLKPFAAIAAAAGLIGIVGIGASNLFSSADSDSPTASMAQEGEAFDGMGADMEAMAPQADDEAPPGPIYTEGGSYDTATLDGLGQRRDIQAALSQAALDPLGFQGSYLQQLSTAAASNQRTSASGGTNDGAQPAQDSSNDVVAESAIASGPSDLLDDVVTRCIPLIMDEDRVPLFADLGDFEGTPALIVVLGARAANGSFDRLEFWALAHDQDCATLFFAQRG